MNPVLESNLSFSIKIGSGINKTGSKLELDPDPDMEPLFIKGLGSGVRSMISTRN